MNIIIAGSTDKGSDRKINQDSYLGMKMRIEGHHVAVAIISDGMGGEVRGDIASSAVVKSFERWISRELPGLIRENATRNQLRLSWEKWLADINNKLRNFGNLRNAIIGATATVLLIIDNNYYVLNVGDSRVYQITAEKTRQLTEDQTITALAVRRGEMTEAEAEYDDRQGILTQAVGMKDRCLQDLYAGRINCDTTFLLCTDGFRHKIALNEYSYALSPDCLTSKEQMKAYIDNFIRLNRKRGETDNISALLIKVY